MSILNMKKLKRILVILSIPASFACGWLFGINEGVNTGYKVAYLEMDNLLKEGVNGGVKFSISGLNARFIPRQDKTLMYKMSGLTAEKDSKRKELSF
ncbi:MAG: hypothetical protein AB1805_01410 [Nitrospirota bacterium]